MTERIKSLLDRTFDKEQAKFRRDVDWKPLLERFVAEGIGDEARARIGLEEMLKAETPAFMDGERLAQAGFLLEVIPLLKKWGVQLAVETSGHVPLADYRAVVSQMDFVCQDVKLLDADAFRRWTGGDIALVLENIAYLRASVVPFAFRVPCIPGVNDSAEARTAFDAFAAGAKVEYLPFNAAAGAKYPMLGRKTPRYLAKNFVPQKVGL